MKKSITKRKELSSKELGFELEELYNQPLEFFAREGARIMLETALNEEVTEFLGRRRYEHSDGNLHGYRNGDRPRQVQCGSGEIEIAKPKIVGADRGFRSNILARWQRKGDALLETLPLLYVEGLSTRDFKRALKPLMGKNGLSKSSISRVTKTLKRSFQEWRKRPLEDKEILYLFLDGYYIGVRAGTNKKEAVLLAQAILKDGKRELLEVQLGVKESTDSWKLLLQGLIDRGLKQPQLVATDGNPGLIRALKEIWPGVAHQRCVVHKARNVLARVPKKDQSEVKKALNRIFHAACLEDALRAAEEFNGKYGEKFPTATGILGSGLKECLTFYLFPERHWKRIRTTNALERTLREVRRRTDVIGRFPNEISALSVIFGVLEENRLNWKGLQIKGNDGIKINEAVKRVKEEPITIKWAEDMEDAA